MKLIKEANEDLLKQHPELMGQLQELEKKRDGLSPSGVHIVLMWLSGGATMEETEEALDSI